MQQAEARSEQMLRDHIARRSLRELGDEHQISRQRVHQIVTREARKMIDNLELELLAATKTGDVVAFAVPAYSASDPASYHAALRHFEWCLAQLRERDIELDVTYHPLPDGGLAFEVRNSTYDDARRS